MRGWTWLGLLAGLCVSLSAAAQTAFSGQLEETDPQFARPLMLPTQGPCRPNAIGVTLNPYDAFHFTVPAPGARVRLSALPADGGAVLPAGGPLWLGLYGPGGVVADQSCQNILFGAGDTTSAPDPRIETPTPMPPGDYTLVVSSALSGFGHPVDPASLLGYRVTLQLIANAPVVEAVPAGAAGTWITLVLGLLGGGALTLRRRAAA